MKFKVAPGTTSISKENDVFSIVDGVVDLPQSLGAELGLEPAGDEPKAKKADEPKAKK